MESKKYNKIDITKKEYREQISNYQWGEGRKEGQYRDSGSRGANYYA